MNSTDDLPVICQKCRKSTIRMAHQSCEFCNKIDFQEEILCYLNQSAQNPDDFKCNAFRPALKLVTPSESEEDKPYSFGEKVNSFLQSDSFKYKKALALQKMKADPDGIYIDIRYHFVWNVVYRIPMFETKEHIAFISDTFQRCDELAGGTVYLVWLASDHVHLYVESTGDISVDEIAQKIKHFSEKEIIKEFENNREMEIAENALWDKGYFVETLG